MKKRLVCFLMAGVMFASHGFNAFATTSSNVQQQIEKSEDALEDARERIEELSKQQAALQNEINTMDADLIDLMISMNVVESEILVTEGYIEETKKTIYDTEIALEEKTAEITQLKKDLAIVEKNRDR